MPEQDPIRRALQRYFTRTQQSMSTDPSVRAIAADPSVAEAQRIYDYDSPGLVDLGVGGAGAAGLYQTGAAGLPAIMRQIAGAASVLGRPEDSVALAAFNPADKKRWIGLAKTAIESGDMSAVDVLTKIQGHAFENVDLNDLYMLTGKYMESGKPIKRKIVESEFADIAASRGGEDIVDKALQKDIFAPRKTDEGTVAGSADVPIDNIGLRLRELDKPAPAVDIPVAPENMLVNPEKFVSMFTEHRRGLPLRGGRPPAIELTQAGVARQFKMSPDQVQKAAALPPAEAIYLDTDSMLRKLRNFGQKNLNTQDVKAATAGLSPQEVQAAQNIVFGNTNPSEIAHRTGVSKERLTELMNDIIKQAGAFTYDPKPGPNKRKILPAAKVDELREKPRRYADTYPVRLYRSGATSSMKDIATDPQPSMYLDIPQRAVERYATPTSATDVPFYSAESEYYIPNKLLSFARKLMTQKK